FLLPYERTGDTQRPQHPIVRVIRFRVVSLRPLLRTDNSGYSFEKSGLYRIDPRKRARIVHSRLVLLPDRGGICRITGVCTRQTTAWNNPRRCFGSSVHITLAAIFFASDAQRGGCI